MSGPARARILVVDDEPGMLRTVERILSRRYEVQAVESGREGLKILESFPAHVAIFDIRMPEMNGFELTRAVKARGNPVDVILMTGNAEDIDETLIRAIDEGAFYFIQKPFDRRVLLTLVDRCLELQRLRAAEEQRFRVLQEELEAARRFQMSLLPPTYQEFTGVSVTARYQPCNQLAGDLYDYIVTNDGCVAAVVADVVGHGAAAAMLTSVVKSAFRSAVAEEFLPRAVLERIREGMRPFEDSQFLTLCCCRIQPGSGELTYINAGHPQPLLCRDDGSQIWLEPTGPLVAPALADLPCDEATCTLHDNDLLLFYTDGVVEARGTGELFGRQRLAAAVGSRLGRWSDVADGILSAVTEFRGEPQLDDDLTLLSLVFQKTH